MLTRDEKAKSIVRIPFYGYIAFLVIGGWDTTYFTYNAIPWGIRGYHPRHNIKTR